MGLLAQSGMTADTYGFLLSVAVLIAIIYGFFKKPKKKTFISKEAEGWYDPTYYYH